MKPVLAIIIASTNPKNGILWNIVFFIKYSETNFMPPIMSQNTQKYLVL
jgi:hypothetical protein